MRKSVHIGLMIVAGLAGFLASKIAFGDALDSWSTWYTAQPNTARQIPPMALVARGEGTDAYYVVEVDPTTGALPIDASGASISIDFSGTPGAAAPASAGYVGGTDGTNLRGLKTDASGELQVDVLSSALPSGAATSANQTSEIALLTTIDGDTGNIATSTANIDTDTTSIATSTATVAGAVSGTEMQVDVLTMPTTTVQATNLDIRDLTSGSDSVEAVISAASTISVENLPATVATNVGAADASTFRVTEGGRSYADSVRHNYVSTNVTTAAWVELSAAWSAASNVVCITDQSGQIMELGVGGAGVESRRFLIPRGFSGCIPLYLGTTRLAVKAVSATADSGDLVITGLQ